MTGAKRGKQITGAKRGSGLPELLRVPERRGVSGLPERSGVDRLPELRVEFRPRPVAHARVPPHAEAEAPVGCGRCSVCRRVAPVAVARGAAGGKRARW